VSAAVVLVIVLAGAIVVHTALFALLDRMSRGHGRLVTSSFVRRVRGPSRFVLPLAAVDVAVATVRLPGPVSAALLRVLGVLIVLATAFLVVRVTYVIDDLVLERYPLDGPDNLRARQVHTQIQVLRRVTAAVVTVLAVAIALLSFPEVRAAGAGLLASAGLIGIVAGVAAKPAATNVVAGLQIAISQPIRVDDVVVVQGHWGRVEQIALTYVVVRVWDLRRLVLPISYFIENPFENWTRQNADILGWVHLEVDYRAPVEQIRQQLHRILRESADWDGNTWNLQVTSLGTETVQLRALMSARDSSAAWNLECEVREKLIAFLQAEHPEALPRLRMEPSPAPAAGAGDAADGSSRPAAGAGRRLQGP
jgi:small-conductance mechanosensitive channel